MIDLVSDDLRVRISPDLGASILSFSARTATGWRALMPEGGGELAASSFVMAPYSNRVRDGAFLFAGRRVQLANAENHAIHGEVRKRPWEVLSPGRLRFRSDGRTSWPWPFEVEMHAAVEGPTFTSRLTLRNLGESAMPAGIGIHPYFLRPARIQFTYDAIYPDAHGTRIPSGPAEPVDAARDFSDERALDPQQFMDFCAVGYDGRGRIVWPDLTLDFACSPELGHLVVYNPDKPYFAIEPVSNANDGFNLFARGDASSGVRVLAPGESLAVTIAMRVSRRGE